MSETDGWAVDAEQPLVKFRRVPGSEASFPLPAYAKDGDAGMDLCAFKVLTSSGKDKYVLRPGDRALVTTNVSAEIPPGYVGLVCPRSGLAISNGITVLNAPGIVDSGYRGAIGVILVNLGSVPFEINRGLRIAQLVIAPVSRARIEEVDTLSETARGEGGFGSTGFGPDVVVTKSDGPFGMPAVDIRYIKPIIRTDK